MWIEFQAVSEPRFVFPHVLLDRVSSNPAAISRLVHSEADPTDCDTGRACSLDRTREAERYNHIERQADMVRHVRIGFHRLGQLRRALLGQRGGILAGPDLTQASRCRVRTMCTEHNTSGL